MAAATPPNEGSIAIAVPVLPAGDDQPQPTVATTSAAAGDEAWKTPQKWLNRFISTVAFMERTGNAVGTLAFTWATVVVLGGFSTDLREDFWYATTIVFLEAFRVFSRENRSDDQLLFKTTGGIRVLRLSLTLELLYFLNSVIVMLCLSIILLIVLSRLLPNKRYTPLLLAGLLVLLAKFPATWLLRRANTSATGRRVRALLLLAPYAAIVALGLAVWLDGAPSGKAVATALPLVFMCFLCQQLIAVREATGVGGAIQRRMMITALDNDPSLSSVSSFARRASQAVLPKLGKILLTVYAPFMVYFLATSFGYLGVYVLFTAVVLGNFQIPVAVARVAISWARLSGRVNRIVTDNVNLVPSLKIFYGLVLVQGALYLAACLTDPFSVVLRRWLARRCRLGTRYVDLYHEHAYDACMEDGILATAEDVNIVTFAVDTLDSSGGKPGREKTRAGLRVLHCFLRSGGSKARLAASKVTTSTNAVATLSRMLGWEPEEDHDVRLLAANVVAEIAGEIRIVRYPGTVQLITSLLDARFHPKKEQGSGGGISGSAQTEADVTNSDSSTSCCCCFRKPNCQRRIKNLWSLPYEVAINDDEHAFPLLGMMILEKLASDPENCAEIGRATNLISKAIGFISCSSAAVTTSSLKLVVKLAGAKGEIGVTLRRKISDHPFLISTLAGILEDDGHREQYWAPVMDIIAKISFHEDTRQEVGETRVIITKLVREFLLSPRDQPSLWAVAGEALAVLTMESPGNCLAIIKEAKRLKEDNEHGHDLVNDLKNMLWTTRDEENGHRCVVVASQLQNLCAHAGDKLRRHPISTEHLASALKVVLEKILDAKGKQLEVLIGLASQIHNAIPAQRFSEALKSCDDNATTLVEKLVGTLKSNQKPSPEWPRMRRATIELAISIMETHSPYTTVFREKGMKKALSEMKKTPSKVERYKLLFGDAGVVLERGLPLPELIAKAKRLIKHE